MQNSPISDGYYKMYSQSDPFEPFYIGDNYDSDRRIIVRSGRPSNTSIWRLTETNYVDIDGWSLYTIYNVESREYMATDDVMFDLKRRRVFSYKNKPNMSSCWNLWKIKYHLLNMYHIKSLSQNEFLFTPLYDGIYGSDVFTWSSNDPLDWVAPFNTRRNWYIIRV